MRGQCERGSVITSVPCLESRGAEGYDEEVTHALASKRFGGSILPPATTHTGGSFEKVCLLRDRFCGSVNPQPLFGATGRRHARLWHAPLVWGQHLRIQWF